MESRKRIPLNPSEAISDLFTAILALSLAGTLFHYGQESSASADPRKPPGLVENP